MTGVSQIPSRHPLSPAGWLAMVLARCYPVSFLRQTRISLRSLVNGEWLSPQQVICSGAGHLTDAQTAHLRSEWWREQVSTSQSMPLLLQPKCRQRPVMLRTRAHSTENTGPYLEPAFLWYSVHKECVFYCLSQCESVFSVISESILPDIRDLKKKKFLDYIAKSLSKV